MQSSVDAPAISRAHVIQIARRWIGTAYHHQASLEGVGCDCIGLVRGIFRELYGREAEALPGYSRDWAEATGIDTLMAAARRHLREVPVPDARFGDVLIFRYRPRLVAKHAGILAASTTDESSLIHALEGAAVCEVPLGGWWQKRAVAAFSFPGIID